MKSKSLGNLPAVTSLILAAASILVSVYFGQTYRIHDGAFYFAAFAGVVLLVSLLLRMTQVTVKDEEIKHQDQTIPFAYVFGFVILLVFYTLEWWLLGCVGAPNPANVGDLANEIATGLSVQGAIYFSVITATTLGYGDLAPLTDGAKIFAASQALGFSIYAVTGLAILSAKRRNPVE
ncbi:potassium channel family protein [Pararobbsia silviterrae]|uniref:Two pore domain potassium channel family protein n=1 Tax=Pararobbsia silviterrae TaxID=1792498 RepID=A0A494YAA6_9BURK|nr:potassium channel family protein [Pararobbsia silviterrae]RKP58670.1 two pore domain potassium channel family protein [Pararobbsia silviterrae]